MAATIMQGVILKNTDFSENDSIVEVFTPLGKISFIAKGTQKQHSKNRAALQVGNLVELEIFLARLNNKVSRLKKASILYQLNVKNNDEVNLILFLIKIWSKLTKGQAFELIKTTYQEIRSKKYKKIKIWNMANLLPYFGYKQNISNCAICGTCKRIFCFSLYAGGLLCIDHKNNSLEQSERKITEFINAHTLNLTKFIHVQENDLSNYLLTFYTTFYKRFLYII